MRRRLYWLLAIYLLLIALAFSTPLPRPRPGQDAWVHYQIWVACEDQANKACPLDDYDRISTHLECLFASGLHLTGTGPICAIRPLSVPPYTCWGD